MTAAPGVVDASHDPAAVSAAGFRAPLATDRKTARNAKSHHAKSLFRDAEFVRVFRDMARRGGLGAAMSALVHYDDPSDPFDPSDPSRSPTSIALYMGPSTSTSADTSSSASSPSPKPVGRKMTPWYERFGAPSSKNHRLGAAWRDTTPYLRGEFAHYALVQAGEFCAMTLNLGAEIEAVALEKGRGAKRYLTGRIAHHLEAALGRRVPFWFRLETTVDDLTLYRIDRAGGKGSRLHLHGEVGCRHAERRKVRKALRKAGGEWELFGSRYQAHTHPAPDNGYVSYAFKNDPGRLHRLFQTNREPSWHDDLFMVSRNLKQPSRALYERARATVRLSGLGLRKLAKIAERERAGPQSGASRN